MGRIKIMIGHQNDAFFYHLLGDSTRFYDLVSLSQHHPEISEYIGKHRYELESRLFQNREEFAAGGIG
jgi:hypothetical protein